MQKARQPNANEHAPNEKATASVTEKHQKLTTWLQQYEALPQRQRRLLQLMSVMYTPMPARTLRDAAIKAKAFRPPQQHAQSLVVFLKQLKKLAKGGFVLDLGDSYALPPMALETLSQEAVAAGEFDLLAAAVIAATQQPSVAIPDRYKRMRRLHCDDYPSGLHQARIAFYRGDSERFDQWLRYFKKEYPVAFAHLHPLAAIFGKTTNLSWFFSLPQGHIWEGLFHGFAAAQWSLRPAGQTVFLANAYAKKFDDALADAITHELEQHDFLQGKWYQEAASFPTAHQGIIALLQGKPAEAIGKLEADLAAFREQIGQPYAFYDGLSGIFLILALLKDGSPESLARAETYLQLALEKKHPLYGTAHQALAGFRSCVLDQTHDAPAFAAQLLDEADDPTLCSLLSWWFVHWLSPPTLAAHPGAKDTVLDAYTKASHSGYDWLAAELGDLLACYGWASEEITSSTKAFWQSHQGLGVEGLQDLFASRPAWEHALEALLQLQPATPKTAPAASSERLVWRLQLPGKQFVLQPYLQKQSASGGWSKGRKIDVHKLGELAHSDEPPAYITAKDRTVCAHIQREQQRAWGGWGRYEMDTEAAILALIGHPHVYWLDQPQKQLQLHREEAQLQLLTSSSDADNASSPQEPSMLLKLDPPLPPTGTLAARQLSRKQVGLIEVTPALQKLASIVGPGLELPPEAKARTLDVLHAIAPVVAIQSDIAPQGEEQATNAQVYRADPRIVVQLSPHGSGLDVKLQVRPLGAEGPRCSPGGGGVTVVTQYKGVTRWATRDLRDEERRRGELLAACPQLAERESTHGLWTLDEPEDCVALLESLEAMGEEIVVEWPKGQSFRIKAHVSGAQFKASVHQERDWFSIDGELELPAGADPAMVLGLRQLLKLRSQHKGRFLPLGEGEFLALSERFRAQLDGLEAYTQEQHGQRQFHPSAAFAMQEIFDDFAEVTEDPSWQRYHQRLQEAPSFAVPAAFQGTLREYQKEGFQWLARLAHWGFGACLADQMGLGKTLQALALLLHRAEGGPALVIAPTSVCANWSDEAARFAPSLTTHDLGQGDPSTRQGRVDALGPGDLLLCSYGLLPFAQSILHQRQWHTVILDEAQAIKNPSTQRAQAAVGLQADCKLITTGTPIENHLGDLWSLFRFLNPGLLGSWEQYQHTFATPIERGEEAAPREQLKQLVQPFILRRHKQDVLTELPSRTDVTLRIAPGPEEAALYEALRQEAIAHINAKKAQGGQLHFHILKELTRLRLACCHPALVTPESELSSAKHDAFMEVLEGLLEEGHKALVFSQFVKHLELLRVRLDEAGIQYQYLDGSTPAKARKKRIDAFQSGEGDVFLISLKAGGSGINLTEADYVLHMDPWWNPAVEDQASDRAHRIGQKNPVTIYRLIMQGTIEEKIVDLHQHKRDLAESLLDGSEMTGKMSADELIALIRSGA